MRLAIDIGGTFTDLVLEKNQTLFLKLLGCYYLAQVLRT